MRRPILVLMLGALILGGCGADDVTIPLTQVDLTQLVTVLPTPQGLDQSTEVRTATAEEVQSAFADGAIPKEARGEYAKRGFKDAAIRTWAGPQGRSATVIASRWPDHFAATNIGGGAAQVLTGRSGAQAWTPESAPGARGVRVVTAGGETRLLAFAVEDISVVVRADGDVTDTAVERSLELLVAQLRAATGRA